MRATTLVLGILIWAAPLPVFAGEPCAEPLITEETLPTELGKWEFNLNFQYWREKTEDVSLWKTPSASLYYGVAEGVSAELTVPFLVRTEKGERSSGAGDLGAGLKWLVREETVPLPALVLGLELGFPTGGEEKELGEGSMEYEPYLAFYKDYLWTIVQGNVGYSYDGRKGTEIGYGLALAFPAGKALLLLAELNGSSALGKNETELYATPGVKYELKEGLGLALGVPLPLSGGSFDRAAAMKLMFEF